MTTDERRTRPPRLVAAGRRPLRLAGEPATVRLRVPDGERGTLKRSIDATGSRSRTAPRLYLNVEDIRAVDNSGAVYGVYLCLPEEWDERVRNRHHVGNVTVFGVETMNEKTPAHDHVPGMRHTFDVTRKARTLRRAGRLSPRRPVAVTFLLELPVPPPGFRGDAGAILRGMTADARSVPMTVGRVSLVVA